MLSEVLAFPRLRLRFSEGLRLPSLRLRMPDKRHWPSSLLLATTAGLYLVAGFSVTGSYGNDARVMARGVDLASVPAAVRARPLSATDPAQLRKIAPTDAVGVNAAIPISALPNPAASAFAFRGGGVDSVRALECLTAAVYYEAAVEPLEGQRAVAQVVLNRVRHPAFPKTVCGVVFQGSERRTGCQFSFTCDGSMRRTPSASHWNRARDVARAALAGYVYGPVGYATHYHTNWVVPYWASSLVKAAEVGTHIFYRWNGGWGRPGAFGGRHAGVEPAFAKMNARSSLPPVAVPLDEVDEAAAAAALAAEDPVESTASVDSFRRAVVRRYEPLNRDTAASANAARLAPTDTSAYRWAITGGTSGRPLGRSDEAPAAPAGEPAAERPDEPRELDGVRRRPAAAE